MIGRVAVGLILPESDGSHDPNLEDWTAEEQAQVIAEVQAAMNWWAAQEPRAHLEFVYDVRLGIPTGYEPISRSAGGGGTHEGLWIREVMAALGYPDPDPADPLSYFDMVWAYNNDLRARLDTEWAFTIFVVDSSADPDGAFSNGRYAGGYLGGPFEFMTYDNGAYGISRMDFIAAHETGHIFRALDEYEGSHLGSDHSGYLNVINGNHVQGGQMDVPCLMKSWYSVPSQPLCRYTREQLGWRDSDGNGVLDPLDTEPDTGFVTYWFDPVQANTLHLLGRAADVPYPQGGPNVITPYPTSNPDDKDTVYIRSLSLNPVVGVEARWDGGGWSSAGIVAQDGRFDEPEEWFRLDLEMLPGPHRVEARAHNQVKYSQPTIERVDASPAIQPVQMPYHYLFPIVAQRSSPRASGARSPSTITGSSGSGGAGSSAGLGTGEGASASGGEGAVGAGGGGGSRNSGGGGPRRGMG